ncbi:MAG: DegT/DnrJ/EryC1/StrS family aminotransferase [Planctomycetaceae bacterium]
MPPASTSPASTSERTALREPRPRATSRADRFLPFSAPDLGESELAELTETLRAGWLSAGPKTRQFEQEFAKFVGVKHAIAVNNGTTAFRLALQALDFQAGDEVIMSPFAPIAAAELVRALGAVPKFVDVTERGLHLCPDLLLHAITERTRAVLISHVAGLPAEMDELLAITRRHGLLVIEDAGQALPATYRHQQVGGLGDVTCFTFFAQKALSLGEGGFICTNQAAIADRCRVLVMSPWDLIPPTLEDEPEFATTDTLANLSPTATASDLTNPLLANGRTRRGRGGSKSAMFDDAQLLALSADGYQASMCDLSAAVGIAQLRKATTMWQRRREIAVTYNVTFSRIVELQCPADRADSQHAWHLYLLRLNLQRLRCSRNQFLAELRARGIGATVMPPPLHLQSAYASLGYQPESCPIATQEYAREISLPIYSRMSDDDTQRVIDAVEGIIKRFRAIPNLPR